MMESNSDNVAGVSVAETLPPFSIGKALSEERARQGLSIADVANSIKFSPRQVEALENDDFGHLPELAFVRGFVRSYAKLLRMDEKVLLNALPPAHQQLSSAQRDLADVPVPALQNRRINLFWLAAALGLAVVLGAGVWLLQDKPVQKKTLESQIVIPTQIVSLPVVSATSAVTAISAVVSTPAPVTATPVATSPAKSSVPVATSLAKSAVSVATSKPQNIPVSDGADQGTIHLVFEAESWVEVKDKYGKILLKQVNPPKSEQWINGRSPFSLVIGNANRVHLYYEGEKIDLQEYTDVEVARLILE